MTEILLIQPPVRDFYLTAKRTLPYGIARIAAALIQDGFAVEILDCLATSKSRVISLPPEMSYLKEFYGKPDISPFGLFHHFRHYGYSFERMGETVKKANPFLVGISSLFTAYSEEAINAAETVKECHPRCKIVLGGHHPSEMPEEVMKCRAVDYVIRGEGEVSMALLAKALRGEMSIEAVPGIVYRKENGTISVSEPAVMDSLNRFPLPAVHLLNYSFYRRGQRASGCRHRQSRLPNEVYLLFEYRPHPISGTDGGMSNRFFERSKRASSITDWGSLISRMKISPWIGLGSWSSWQG